VQVFDNKTWQETEDEQGKGKVQVVMDWPNGAGIEEAKVKSFF
jgi:hypothetical protein